MNLKRLSLFVTFLFITIFNIYGQETKTKDKEVYNDGKYLDVAVEQPTGLSDNKYTNKSDSIKSFKDFKKPNSIKGIKKPGSIKDLKDVDLKDSGVAGEVLKEKLKPKNSANDRAIKRKSTIDTISARVKKIEALEDYKDDFIDKDFLKKVPDGKQVYDTLGLTQDSPFGDDPTSLDKIFGDEVDGMDKFKEQLDVMPDRKSLGSQISKPSAQILDTLQFAKIRDNKATKKMKGWKNKYREHSSKVKELSFKKKGLLPVHNMFLEGILSVPTSGFDEFGITPQAGFKITKRLSGGVGLVFQYNGAKESPAPTLTLGYKAFVRYQVLIDKLYLQSEAVFYHPKYSVLSEGNSGPVEKDFSLLVGGGYEVTLSPTKRLSFAMFYNLKKVSFVPGLNSPFVARIGLGMLK